ncbi:MAG: OadG family transporter subunit [Coprococcus sp.]
MKKKLLTSLAVLLPVLTLSGCDSQLGSKLVKAGMNTLMGMGTVFIILIFIAFIISRFKYISRLESWIRNRDRHEEVLPVQQKAEEEKDMAEEENVTDDLALVAVITAALAASLATSPDKLVVRSIRRKNMNRW